MSDADNAFAATDAHEDHPEEHGHTSPSEPLGPVDGVAWGYAIVGAAIGILVVLALFVARGS
jgi:hypothetical protein